jgi:hypothetical protein
MEPHELIEGHDKVEAAFGGWPSFHDAEVHRIVLERAVPTGPMPRVEVVIHAWNMTDQIDENGYRLAHHHLVSFAFDDVSEVELDGFNHQNVLSDLLLQSVDEGSFRVELAHCFGVSSSFIAKRGRVLAVTPCDDKGK